MVNLECWLPEKEMFGVFVINSISAKADALEVIVSNEVFQFTISFLSGVKEYQVRKTSRAEDFLNILREGHEVLMRGNTFFKWSDSACNVQSGKEGEQRYLIAAPNYVVDLLADTMPTVALVQAKK